MFASGFQGGPHSLSEATEANEGRRRELLSVASAAGETL